jgi:hypothetical protein
MKLLEKKIRGIAYPYFILFLLFVFISSIDIIVENKEGIEKENKDIIGNLVMEVYIFKNLSK